MLNLRLLVNCSSNAAKACRLLASVSIPRKSSNYKRPQRILPRSGDHLMSIKTGIFQCRKEMTEKEWQETRQTLIDNYKHITPTNIDAIVLSMCNEAQQLPLAKDYVRYLRSNGVRPNAATMGRLLRVYNAAYHAQGGDSQALTRKEQDEILEIYTSLRQTHDVLDATSCENLIHGLVATEQWQAARELLEMNKLTCTPSSAAYTELAVKAFRMQDIDLGWQLLEELLELRKHPKCEIFMAYLEAIERTPKEFLEKFEKLLQFLEKHDLVITQKVVDKIKGLGERFPTLLTAVSNTKLNRAGKCAKCGNHMQNVTISDAEYAQLSDSFLHKVLIRNDVFQKSTPEEVERFKGFVEQTGPYDCVIDGLNVAYSSGSKKSPHVLANLLASVVKYFHNKNKHVLVLGRKHMHNWPKDSMQFVRKNASVFLTNNLTHDDPFLLYATIKSGQMTDFFSRDLMRSHAFLLGPELKTIFRRWQQEHQYSLVTQTESGKIIVKEPIRHLVCAHKVKNTWHLPYKKEYSANPPETFEFPELWLCVKTQK